MPLLDLIEETFASDDVRRTVQRMDEEAQINLDNESLELILVGHAFATAGEAGQSFRPTPDSDLGLDGEIEFKDASGQLSGRKVYLLFQMGMVMDRRSYRDQDDTLRIQNPPYASRWLHNAYTVMVVTRSANGRIQWMNLTDHLQRHGPAPSHIPFSGEPFTALNLVRLRDRLFGLP